MSVVIQERNIPYIIYDPSNRNPAYEAAWLTALTDGSDGSAAQFDYTYSGIDQGDAIWFVVDADDLPTETVLSITFTIRAQVWRADDPLGYITYTALLVPFDGAAGHVVYGDGSDDHWGLRIPPGGGIGEEAVYLSDDEMGEALAAVVDPNSDWFAYNETWSNVNGFVTHLRNHGGLRFQLHATTYNGLWYLMEASLVMEVEVASGSAVQQSSPRVHFTG